MLRLASSAYTFYYILCLVGHETGGQCHGWYLDTRQAEGSMAASTSEVDMTVAMARVIEMADAVFLCS